MLEHHHTSAINQLRKDNLLRTAADAVHPSHPFHLILSLQPLSDTLSVLHLRDQLIKHFLCCVADFLVLEFEGQSKLAIYHTKLMQTDWKPTESCTIELRGLNLDKVWENIIRSLELGVWNEELSLDENLALHEKQAKLKKEIEKLEKQARAEKQPKKKFELVQQIKKLKEKLI